MKVLVVFYSRTGTTRKVAESISRILGCDVEEIFDTKNRSGIWGYLMAGRDAMLGRLTVIREIKKDPALYDIVIIGTPVWAYTMSMPIRTYLSQNKDKLRKVAFFCTQGGSGSKGAFRQMEELCGKKPAKTRALKTREVVKGEHLQKVREFAEELLKTEMPK